jgi:mannitol-1-phosphate/altronate dehydrogenase
LEAFADQWRRYGHHRDALALCRALLARSDFWGEDLSALPDLTEGVGTQLSRIVQTGVHAAVATLG